MSIFYSDTSSSQQPKKQEEISVAGAVGIGATVIAIIIYQKAPSAEVMYFRTFKFIWMGSYVLIALSAATAIWQILKYTKKLTERTKLLFQASRKSGSLFAGRTTDGVPLFLSEKDRCGHVQVLGSTGRGKTESVIIPWMCRDLLAGRNAILIDGKGDPEILEKIIRTGNQTCSETEVHVFDLGNPDLSCSTNPLKSGSPQQITDRIFTAFTFDDSYYKSVQYDITGTVVQLIQSLGKEVTFRGIYECLTNDDCLTEALTKTGDTVLKQKVSRHLTTPKNSRDEKLSGLLTQLAPFAVGEIAELVNGPTQTRKCWTVSDIIFRENDLTQQHVLAILIPTLKYQQIGHQLGKLILQELGWAIGERASQKGRTAEFLPVYLDEFSAFVYPGFTNILNKARSSKIALHLSHQSLADLSLVSREVAEVIVTNTNVKCILGLNDPKSADFMACHIGTKTEEKLTEQAQDQGFLSKKERTGRMSIREVEAYKIHPNLLKNFMNGRGVLHLPTPLGNISEEIQFEPLSDGEIYAKGVGDE